ncbi:MAG: GNAT family N-acetyltransferase [Kiritimatiellaeota bacterium]|nr:GNAT family N-acetyltransferase [Kiritimatiellota bacterium]
MMRALKPDDVPRIQEIAVRAWRGIYESYRKIHGEELYQRLYAEAPASKGADVRRFCEQFPENVRVCEEAGRVVGFITFQLNAEKKIGVLDNNAVDPECGLKGIGQQMYAVVLDHFRRMGMDYAQVTTGLDESHARARRAYERAGFNIHKDQTVYYMKL